MNRHYHTPEEWERWRDESQAFGFAWGFPFLFGVNQRVHESELEYFEHIYVPVPHRYCARIIKIGAS